MIDQVASHGPPPHTHTHKRAQERTHTAHCRTRIFVWLRDDVIHPQHPRPPIPCGGNRVWGVGWAVLGLQGAGKWARLASTARRRKDVD